MTLKPVASVRSERVEMGDDFWGGIDSEIELATQLPKACLDGVEEYSHLEIVYVLDQVPETAVVP